MQVILIEFVTVVSDNSLSKFRKLGLILNFLNTGTVVMAMRDVKMIAL